MDQGLFCHFSDGEISLHDVGEDDSEIPRHVVVYNPTTETIKTLPCPPVHHTVQEFPVLALHVGNVTHNFRLFMINHGFDTSMDDPKSLMHVYDSVSGDWKPAKNPVGIKYGNGVVSSVVFKGILYVVLTFFDDHGDRSLNRLWTYDLKKDEWDNLPLEVPPEFIPCPTLVCNENHLYLVEWSMKLFPASEQITVEFSTDIPWCYEVREAILEHPLRLVTRFRLLESVMESNLEVVNWPIWDPNDMRLLPPQVRATPYDDCLMLVSLESGKVMICALDTCVFDAELPKLPMCENTVKSWVHRKQMNLMLPSTPWL